LNAAWHIYCFIEKRNSERYPIQLHLRHHTVLSLLQSDQSAPLRTAVDFLLQLP
ncbi:hypothetical protein T10_3748, partial [Trichinella papuae]